MPRRVGRKNTLPESELFTLLQDNVKDHAIFVLDLEGNVMTWTQGAHALLGYSEDEIVGKPFSLLFTAEDQALGRPERELHTACTESRADDENWLVRKDNSRFWASGSTSALRDESGKLRAFAKIVHDLTQRRRWEEQLQRSEQRLRGILESIDDAFFALDREWRFVYVNHRAEQLWEIARENLLGRVMWEVFPGAVGSESYHRLHQALEEERTVEFETISPVLGTWIGVRAYPSPEGLAVYFQDISGRKLAEDELQKSYSILHTIVEGTSDVVFVKDLQGRYVLVNSSAARVIGCAAEDIVGKDDYCFFPRDIASRLVETDRAIMASNEGQTLEEEVVSGGARRVFLTSKVPYVDRHGEVIGLIGIAQDITARVAFEQRKDAFISLAGHELRTPLTSLKGFTQILEKRAMTQGDDASSRILSRMDSQIDRLTALIREILDASQIQQGQLVFETEEFLIDDFIRDVVEDMRHTSSSHQILVDARTHQTVRADKDRTAQVLVNLISNAIKYSPGAASIRVQVTHDSRFATVCVRDAGIGIAPEDQPRVFERFFRVRSKDTAYAGLGLGLHIAKEIVERQGGAIWVESTVGQGSTFCFTLPLATA